MLRRLQALIVLGLLIILGVACPPIAPTPTPTATATPSATATPTFTPSPTPLSIPPPGPPTSVPKDAFGTFAWGITVAVEKGDAASVVSATVSSQIDCRGLTEETPWCSKEDLGRVLSGVRVGPWRSEYFLFGLHDYQLMLGRFFAEAQAGASDGYGPGRARLMAVGYPGGQERDLVVSAITPRGREALLLRSEAQGGRWVITGVVVVGPPFVEEVLPPGRGHYPTEPWPGG